MQNARGPERLEDPRQFRDRRDGIIEKKGGTYMEVTRTLSEQERSRREKAVQFARNSVRLEGFILKQEAEALNRRYINGELTSAEHTAALLALAGSPGH